MSFLSSLSLAFLNSASSLSAASVAFISSRLTTAQFVTCSEGSRSHLITVGAAQLKLSLPKARTHSPFSFSFLMP